MRKKKWLVVLFSLAAVLIVGQIVFAAGSESKTQLGNMMFGNHMSGRMSDGNMGTMTKMMGNGSMDKMMEWMNTPEG